MKSLQERLTNRVAEAFAACGYDRKYGEVELSDRPDLSQFQCNGALVAAKQYKMNPRQLAQQVVDKLSAADELREVSLAGPGFINLTVTDAFLTTHIQAMGADERLGCANAATPLKMIVDYGGANIAKPLHVGHLRAAIIGESLKRLARFLGHEVIGDVHLGDWGLQMGMVIFEIARRYPPLPYFDAAYTGTYPDDAPITVADLEEIYPTVSAQAKEDPAVMEACQRITYELQHGQRGYRALWKYIYDISVADLKADYGTLNIEFDWWLGESNTQERIPAMIEGLKTQQLACESQGALVVEIAQPDDKKEIPPLMLVKSDGAVLYGTTDLATIEQRVQDVNPDLILYVVDKRQSDHFLQVFRGAHKTGIAPASLQLEHIGFGTMNGTDGKPFKTRAGGVMKLKELIAMVTVKALAQMARAEIAREYDEVEKAEIARKVGVATLKFADLMNHPSTDYVFDLDRFSSFDGRTGPYLLYAAVRIKSILRKAAKHGLQAGTLLPPASDAERELFLKITELPTQLNIAFEKRAPNYICDYAYMLASLFTRFYHDHHILREADSARQASWLQLARIVLAILERLLNLLGMEIPERM